MGREIRCMAEVGDWTGQGRLLLETDELIFRGARKRVIPLRTIRGVAADNGWLVVGHEQGTDRFDIGPQVDGWVRAIQNPRSRIDKLGVKPTSRALVIGAFEADFFDELRARVEVGGALHVMSLEGDVESAGSDLDLVFLRVDDVATLVMLGALRERIASNGAIWLIHPKGHAELKHELLVTHAKRSGLIDTKTARFSDTHTSMKLVIPKAQRRS